MASLFKAIGSGTKIGASPGTGPTITTPPQWVAGTVYAANSRVVNGGFSFKTTAGGTASATANTPGPTPNTLTDGTVTWVVEGPIAGLHDVDTVQNHELGTVIDVKDVNANSMGEAEYVKFTGNVKAGDFVVFDQFGKTCVQLATGSGGAGVPLRVGVSLCSAASGNFGWVLIRGVHDTANVVSTAIVAGTVLATATGGQVNSSATTAAATDVAQAFIRRVPVVTGAGPVELMYPFHIGL